jgi:uncharacterized protein YabN with tetrapyrrole methylase and pyrophosphatase domain
MIPCGLKHVERRAKEMKLKLVDITLAEMDELWNDAKTENY